MALVRLDRWLSQKGYCTRREADLMAKDGRITYQGKVLSSGSDKVDGSGLLIDGEPGDPEVLYLLLNKPEGCTCSHNDVGTLVYSLFPERWNCRKPLLSGVGRLDRDTSGALLFTDDGPLLHRLTSPRYRIEKVYEVWLKEAVSADDIALIESGSIHPADEPKPFRPGRVTTTDDSCHLYLTLIEGRYHEVKRMFAALDNEVVRLHRCSFAGLSADTLEPGKWRILTASEVERLRELTAGKAAGSEEP